MADHRNCLPRGYPAKGIHAGAVPFLRKIVPFTCTVCGRKWKPYGLGWVPA